MCGRDTLAMLVSSTSMNVARVTASAMIQGLTAGRGGRSHPRSVPRCSSHPDLGLDRHTRPENMLFGLSRVKGDLDRDPLHYFDVVTRGIFRRKQAKQRAAGTSDALHVAVVFLAVGID